jgi:hypothetical protein
MVAAATGFDKIALVQSEAHDLSKAVVEVQKFYPLHVSEKALAWANLCMVAGAVYGSRIVAVWADMEAANAKPPTVNAPATLHTIRPA